MTPFQVGDRVAYEDAHRIAEGTVTRVNPKVITIEGDNGLCSRISPEFLSKTVAPTPSAKKRSNVLNLSK